MPGERKEGREEGGKEARKEKKGSKKGRKEDQEERMENPGRKDGMPRKKEIREGRKEGRRNKGSKKGRKEDKKERTENPYTLNPNPSHTNHTSAPPNPPLCFCSMQAVFQENRTINKNCVKHVVVMPFLF